MSDRAVKVAGQLQSENEQLRADLAVAREQLEIARASTNAELRKHDKGPTTDEQRRQEYLFILSCLGYDFEAEVGKLRADLAAARAERDAIQHDLDAHLGNGAPAHECLVDKYRAACKDLNSQLANADEANEQYRIALAAARAALEVADAINNKE